MGILLERGRVHSNVRSSIVNHNFQIKINNTADSLQVRFDTVEELKLINFDVVAFAKGYSDHGKYGLAFQTLCQALFEYGVSISTRDYEMLNELAHKFYQNNDYDWNYVGSLARL